MCIHHSEPPCCSLTIYIVVMCSDLLLNGGTVKAFLIMMTNFDVPPRSYTEAITSATLSVLYLLWIIPQLMRRRQPFPKGDNLGSVNSSRVTLHQTFPSCVTLSSRPSPSLQLTRFIRNTAHTPLHVCASPSAQDRCSYLCSFVLRPPEYQISTMF